MIDEDKSLLNLVLAFVKQSPKHIQEKDANKWLTTHPDNNSTDFARIILSNIYEGNKGIFKIKLRK